MRHLTPKRIFLISFLLLLLGVILPFLMVMEVIKSTLFLNFFSFIVSLLGVVAGILATVYYVRINRGDQ